MLSATCLKELNPADYLPHELHGAGRNWPQTNCYVDLWIEVLHAMGYAPEAALGFTLLQDFEGDQFTFFKCPPEDLELLFGLRVQELAIYDSVEKHALQQLSRGNLVLAEVDGFYLPDTTGTSYRVSHVKTTIAINHIDLESRCLHYFHNAGYYSLSKDDYSGVFRSNSDDESGVLFPYVEFVKQAAVKPVMNLSVVLELLRKHLANRPISNPVRSYQLAFPEHIDGLAQHSMEYFHLYTFNLLRQLGANFELLASHLAWLELHGEAGLDNAKGVSNELAGSAKTLQFQLARAVNHTRFESFAKALDPVALLYDQLMDVLVGRYGSC